MFGDACGKKQTLSLSICESCASERSAKGNHPLLSASENFSRLPKFNSFQRDAHFLELCDAGGTPQTRNSPLALSQNVKSCFLRLEFSISGIDLMRA
jgi:hypothetical protein